MVSCNSWWAYVHHMNNYHGLQNSLESFIFIQFLLYAINPLSSPPPPPSNKPPLFRGRKLIILSPLPRTQMSLSRWKCGRKERQEGDNRVHCGSSPVTHVSRSPLWWEKQSASGGNCSQTPPSYYSSNPTLALHVDWFRMVYSRAGSSDEFLILILGCRTWAFPLSILVLYHLC